MNQLQLFSHITSRQLWMVATLAGLALGLGTVLPVLRPLAVTGIIVSVLLLLSIASRKTMLMVGWYVWAIKYALALVWFWSIYPFMDMEANSPGLQLLAVFIGFVVAFSSLALGGCVFAGLLFCLKNKVTYRLYLYALLTAIFWVIAEVIGSYAFSVATLGSGSSIQSYFSFGYVGYQSLFIPGFIHFAQFGGVYLLTSLLVMLSLAAYWLFQGSRWRELVLGIIAMTVITIVITPPTYEKKGTTVASLDTRFAVRDEFFARNQTVLNEAIAAVETHAPDYLILPEDARFLDTNVPAPTRQGSQSLYSFTHSGSKTLIIDSARTELGNGSVAMRALLFSAGSPSMMQIDKQYLVPQAEYGIYLFAPLVKILGMNDSRLNGQGRSRYIPGPETMIVKDSSIALPGLLFCFESVRPTAARVLAKEGVPFIAHPIAHAWFHDARMLWPQLDTMLRIQSVWSGLPIISAGNMADAKVYRPDGTYEVPPAKTAGEGWTLRMIEI